MLTITPMAETALTNARTEKGAPDDYGVRFFATTEPESEKARLAFKFVESPQPDDTVMSDGSIEAYVAPEVNEVMGDIIVDAVAEGGVSDLVLRRPETT
jgi:Fe-S cluster assembly iron-binding protein IscA